MDVTSCWEQPKVKTFIAKISEYIKYNSSSWEIHSFEENSDENVRFEGLETEIDGGWTGFTENTQYTIETVPFTVIILFKRFLLRLKVPIMPEDVKLVFDKIIGKLTRAIAFPFT